MENFDILDEEYCLEFILRALFNENDIIIKKFFDLKNFKPAFDLFKNHYIRLDQIEKTNHYSIICKMFSNRLPLNKVCTYLGISGKTFYRYKHKYLQVFEYYLFLTLESK